MVANFIITCFLLKSLTFGYEDVLGITSPCFASIILTISLKFTLDCALPVFYALLGFLSSIAVYVNVLEMIQVTIFRKPLMLRPGKVSGHTCCRIN